MFGFVPGPEGQFNEDFLFFSHDLYAAARGRSQDFEYIQTVETDKTFNYTGAEDNDLENGYGDYSHLRFPFLRGQDTELRLTPGFPSGGFPESWKVWIDHNQDGDFEDAGEEVLAFASATGQVQRAIQVPTGARDGATRMRVAMSYSSLVDLHPHGEFTFGEVEDYTALLYCESQSTSSDWEWVAEVQFGNNLPIVSSSAQYSDHTDHIIDLVANTCIEFRGVPGYSDFAFEEHWQVWADWDQNGRFEGPSERMAITPTGQAQSGEVFGAICTPPNARPGSTRLRVTMSYSTSDLACGEFSYGEVEDFSAYVNYEGNGAADSLSPSAPADLVIVDVSNGAGTEQ